MSQQTTSDDTETSNTAPVGASLDEDPSQVLSIMQEAFAVSSQDAMSVAEEGCAVQAMTQSYQQHVMEYAQSFAQTWETTMQTFQEDVENWQIEVTRAQDQAQADAQTHVQATAANATPQKTSAAPSSMTNDQLQEQLLALKNRLSGQSTTPQPTSDTPISTKSTPPDEDT